VSDGARAQATLADLQSVLALFAQALAGQPVALHTGPPHPPAPCDARAQPLAITLPAHIDTFDSARDNCAAYRIAVMRQALAGTRDVALPAPASRLWHHLFAALERLRIDAAIARRYPGARSDLARLRAHELAHRRARPARRWPAMRTLELLWRHALGDDARRDDERMLWRALLLQAEPLRRDGASALDSAAVASAICRWLAASARRLAQADATPIGDSAAPKPAAPGAAAETREGGARVDPGTDTVGAALAPADVQAGAVAGGTLALHDGRDTTAARPSPSKPTQAARDEPPHRTATAATAASAPQHTGEPGLVVPIDEWDHRQQRLLPAWCTLIERRQHGSDIAFIHQVRRRHGALARRVHQQFAAWRPEGLQRVHGASDGDELELDRLIEALVDRRAGRIDDSACYVRRDRAQRDVATALLLDTSASTDFVLPEGPAGPPRPAPSPQADVVYLYDLAVGAPPPGPPKRRVIDVAKEALALMCHALHTLGDCFAVYTFSGHGRDHVDFRIVKRFDEAVSSRTAAALAALRPHGATRTGAAIRHASAQLLRQSQRRRALIVVTDGYPEDIDYGPHPRDLQYGLEDTAHALLEAQALGLQTFCLSIDPAGHDYLRRMCPPHRYLVIGDLAALPSELAKVYRTLTRPA